MAIEIHDIMAVDHRLHQEILFLYSGKIMSFNSQYSSSLGAPRQGHPGWPRSICLSRIVREAERLNLRDLTVLVVSEQVAR
eukprot:gene19529-6732_t